VVVAVGGSIGAVAAVADGLIVEVAAVGLTDGVVAVAVADGSIEEAVVVDGLIVGKP
jgi:hypothetical protein